MKQDLKEILEPDTFVKLIVGSRIIATHGNECRCAKLGDVMLVISDVNETIGQK